MNVTKDFLFLFFLDFPFAYRNGGRWKYYPEKWKMAKESFLQRIMLGGMWKSNNCCENTHFLPEIFLLSCSLQLICVLILQIWEIVYAQFPFSFPAKDIFQLLWKMHPLTCLWQYVVVIRNEPKSSRITITIAIIVTIKLEGI